MAEDAREARRSGLGNSGPLVQVSSSVTTNAPQHPLAVSPPTRSQLDSSSSNTRTGSFPMNHLSAPRANEPIPTPPAWAVPSSEQPYASTGTSTVDSSLPSAPTTLSELADVFLSGPSRRSEKGMPVLLNPPELPVGLADLDRMRYFVERRSWGDALSITSPLLRESNSHYASLFRLLQTGGDTTQSLDSHQSELIEILMVQCHCLLKLRRYQELSKEVESWRFCYHQGGECPGWVPFSIHILAASSLQYGGDKERCEEILWSIRANRSNSSNTNQLDVVRCDVALLTLYSRMNDFRMALACLDRLLESVHFISRQDPVLSAALRCHLLSQQLRLLLQCGSNKGAEAVMLQVEAVYSNIEGETEVHDEAVKLVPVQLMLNRGLVSFAQQKYDEALEYFLKASNSIPQADVGTGKYKKEYWMNEDIRVASTSQDLYSETLNNISLCALYTSRIPDAIRVMERLVREDPWLYLTERIALNLCTLYELNSDSAMAARKKRTLQQIAKRFDLHDIGPESFRLG